MNFLHLLSLATAPASPTSSERLATVNVMDRSVEILVRRHPRARRVKLTLDRRRGHPVLTLPPGVDEQQGLAFLDRNSDWVLSQLDQLPVPVRFVSDTVIPIRGQGHRILHRPEARAGVFVADSAIVVSGEADHLARRLTDFLKREARQAVKPLAEMYTAQLCLTPRRVAVRDQRTRWGSCSVRGDLSFSWRLILAPPSILDYVVAHEVAHLRHMNHSSAFWDIVEQLHPNHNASRNWLVRHGAGLHRVG